MKKLRLSKQILSLAISLVMLFSLAPQTFSVSAATTSTMSLQGERIYQIMTDRFYDGDSTNNATGEALRYQEVTAEDMRYMKGGDWQGIIDKLPYIKGMGYTAIWISPIMDPQLWSVPDAAGVQGSTAYHGYHAIDGLMGYSNQFK